MSNFKLSRAEREYFRLSQISRGADFPIWRPIKNYLRPSDIHLDVIRRKIEATGKF